MTKENLTLIGVGTGIIIAIATVGALVIGGFDRTEKQIAANAAAIAELRTEFHAEISELHAADAELLRMVSNLAVFVKSQHPDMPDTLLAKATKAPASETPTEALETPPPLHIAARENDTAKAQRLLGNGADVNIKYNGGETPLHAAAEQGAADVAALLLKHGADISAKDSGGETPLHIAEHKGHTNVAQLIRNHRATG